MSTVRGRGRPAVFVQQLHRAAAQRGKLDPVYQDLSDHWTVGALAMTNFGRARSDFGSLPQTANFLVKVARYL